MHLVRKVILSVSVIYACNSSVRSLFNNSVNKLWPVMVVVMEITEVMVGAHDETQINPMSLTTVTKNRD